MPDLELLDPFQLDALLAIPIRSFALAKQRLGGTLDQPQRHDLARTLAEQVLGAAGRLSVLVVSSDPEVVAWAESRLVFTLADPGTLNRAAEAAREWAGAHHISQCVIAHADLAFADAFERVLRPGVNRRAVIVPDRFDDGTPVMSIPTHGPFEFAYGPGSFRAHCDAASTAGFDVEVFRDVNLGFDVDEPDDLALMRGSDG